jgi:hypothetical protein
MISSPTTPHQALDDVVFFAYHGAVTAWPVHGLRRRFSCCGDQLLSPSFVWPVDVEDSKTESIATHDEYMSSYRSNNPFPGDSCVCRHCTFFLLLAEPKTVELASSRDTTVFDGVSEDDGPRTPGGDGSWNLVF